MGGPAVVDWVNSERTLHCFSGIGHYRESVENSGADPLHLLSRRSVPPLTVLLFFRFDRGGEITE